LFGVSAGGGYGGLGCPPAGDVSPGLPALCEGSSVECPRGMFNLCISTFDLSTLNFGAFLICLLFFLSLCYVLQVCMGALRQFLRFLCLTQVGK
jgi:hypothetical protein